MKFLTYSLLFLASFTYSFAGIFGFGNDSLAVKGYDLVSYHQETGPIEGSKKFSTEHQEKIYRFANKENLAIFNANPASYLPAYGGYCAYGVAKGGKYQIDPLAYNIIEGKLYLNYDKKVQALWEKDIPGYIEKADNRWPKIR